jgi:hypothetical protein
MLLHAMPIANTMYCRDMPLYFRKHHALQCIPKDAQGHLARFADIAIMHLQHSVMQNLAVKNLAHVVAD